MIHSTEYICKKRHHKGIKIWHICRCTFNDIPGDRIYDSTHRQVIKPWSRVVRGKVAIVPPLRELSELFGTRNSIPCSQQKAVVSILRKTSPTYTPLPCFLNVQVNIIFLLCFGFLIVIFPSGCPTDFFFTNFPLLRLMLHTTANS
jgi:hypothetical protein